MPQEIAFPQLLTEEQTAEVLKVCPATLATWRCTRRYQLPYVKAGRLVRYRAQDVFAFIDRRLVGGVGAGEGEHS